MQDNNCLGEILIQGWKGKSGIEIVSEGKDEQGRYYILVEWRKHKDTGENYSSRYKLYEIYVLNMLDILSRLNQGQIYKSKEIRKLVINYYNLFNDIDLNMVQKGKLLFGNRALLFKYYYYPLKFLEAKGKINYSEDGDIQII